MCVCVYMSAIIAQFNTAATALAWKYSARLFLCKAFAGVRSKSVV